MPKKIFTKKTEFLFHRLIWNDIKNNFSKHTQNVKSVLTYQGIRIDLDGRGDNDLPLGVQFLAVAQFHIGRQSRSATLPSRQNVCSCWNCISSKCKESKNVILQKTN